MRAVGALPRIVAYAPEQVAGLGPDAHVEQVDLREKIPGHLEEVVDALERHVVL